MKSKDEVRNCLCCWQYRAPQQAPPISPGFKFLLFPSLTVPLLTWLHLRALSSFSISSALHSPNASKRSNKPVSNVLSPFFVSLLLPVSSVLPLHTSLLALYSKVTGWEMTSPSQATSSCWRPGALAAGSFSCQYCQFTNKMLCNGVKRL